MRWINPAPILLTRQIIWSARLVKSPKTGRWKEETLIYSLMADSKLSKDNHYVSQGCLKQWESSPGKVFVYHVLVSHPNVPLWVEKNIKGIAYHQHLYTRQVAGVQSDEIERWFSAEFESPAESPIQQVVSEDCLTPDDWYKLVRFLAMHDVRTPAKLIEFFKGDSGEYIQKSLEEILNNLPEKLEEMKKKGIAIPVVDDRSAAFPLKVTTEIQDGEEFGLLKAETAIGRATWLWKIQHLLNNTAKVLHQHRWTILRPAVGMSWFTTDNPVIRLNYESSRNYNFNGGWGSKGTEILFPLSPQHMLYTRIGHKPPIRGSRFTADQTNILRRLMAEHAHRYVFAGTADAEVATYRPRIVNAEFFKGEEQQWQRWHEEQTDSENYLFDAGN